MQNLVILQPQGTTLPPFLEKSWIRLWHATQCRHFRCSVYQNKLTLRLSKSNVQVTYSILSSRWQVQYFVDLSLYGMYVSMRQYVNRGQAVCIYFTSRHVRFMERIWHFTRVGVVWRSLLSGYCLLLSWHCVCLHRKVGSLVACGCRDLHLFGYNGNNKNERRIKRFASRQQRHPRQMIFLQSWFNGTWSNWKNFVTFFFCVPKLYSFLTATLHLKRCC